MTQYSSGLCAACYLRRRYHNDPDYRRKVVLKRRKWRTENPEKQAEYNKKWYWKNREHSLLKVREARKRNGVKWNLNKRLRLYGITLEAYNSILESQNGLCAICDRTLISKSSAVDHEHLTGKVRGILCSSCNRALGLLRDSDSLLLKAISYLRKHSHILRASSSAS